MRRPGRILRLSRRCGRAGDTALPTQRASTPYTAHPWYKTSTCRSSCSDMVYPAAPGLPALAQPSGCTPPYPLGTLIMSGNVSPSLDSHGNGNCILSAIAINADVAGACNGPSCVGCNAPAYPAWAGTSRACGNIFTSIDLDAARAAGVLSVTVIFYAGGTDAFGHNPTGNSLPTTAQLGGGPIQSVNNAIPASGLHDSNFGDFCWSSLGAGVAATCVINTVTGAFTLN